MLLLPALIDPPLPGCPCFVDHFNSNLVYHLPIGLQASTDAVGQLSFIFARFREQNGSGGGLLRTTLGWQRASELDIQAAEQAGRTLQPVPWRSVRFRLIRRAPGATDVQAIGPWQPGFADGTGAVTARLDLDDGGAQLMQQLLEQQVDVLEMQVTAEYVGLVNGVPWFVSADANNLTTLLHASLGDDAHTKEEIVAAFMDLPSDATSPLSLQSLGDSMGPLEPSRLAVELTERSLGMLFGAEAGSDGLTRYRLQFPPTAGSTVSFDLSVPRMQIETADFAWSITSLYASLADASQRERYFPSLQTIEPYATVTIPVVCDVPFDPKHLLSVHCDARFTGPAGVPQYQMFEFPSGGMTQRFTATYPALTDSLALATRTRCTLAPPGGAGWPSIVQSDFAPNSTAFVDITRQSIGIDFVRADLDSAAAALVASVSIAIQRNGADRSGPPLAVEELGAAHRGAWIALQGIGPGDALDYSVDASPTPAVGGSAITISAGPVVDRHIALDASDLRVSAPDVVSISLDPAAAPRFAYVAVTVEPPTGAVTTRTLSVDEPLLWSMYRKSVFDALVFRYQLELVAFDDNHRTLPMQTSDWTECEGGTLVISPSVPAIAAPSASGG